MMLAMMTSACLAAAAMMAQPALDEPAQIMVEFRLIEADLTTGRTWVMDPFGEEPKPSIRFDEGGTMELDNEGMRFASIRSTNSHFILSDDAIIDVSGWRYLVGGPNEGLDDSPFALVAAPRILLYDGMPASVTIGHRVEYLEPADEPGTFRVAVTDVHEGIKFGITPVLRPDGSILLEPLTFELHEVIEREDVEGLSIPGVGKPVIESTEREVMVVVGAGLTAVVPLGHRDFAERPLLLLVRPSVVSKQPSQNENTHEESGASEEESGSPE